uniref:Secreted protein n=1 Tax=Arundo donax TaxID=35708 RepID=A0A0A8Y2X5_ARUDO
MMSTYLGVAGAFVSVFLFWPSGAAAFCPCLLPGLCSWCKSCCPLNSCASWFGGGG